MACHGRSHAELAELAELAENIYKTKERSGVLGDLGVKSYVTRAGAVRR